MENAFYFILKTVFVFFHEILITVSPNYYQIISKEYSHLKSTENSLNTLKSKWKLSELLFLRKAHSTTDCERKWKDEFGGDFHISHGSSNSCRVLIAF